MKITRIEVKNYRLLKDFSIDLEDELSLVIGKNNCGKTSLLSILDIFLNEKTKDFSFNDFNLDFKDELKNIIESDIPETYKPIGITLKLCIEYNSNDDLSNISDLMMDLDPANNKIVLLFEYVLTFDKLKQLKDDYSLFRIKEDQKSVPKELFFFLRNNFSKYFCVYKKTIDLKNETNYIDLDKAKISIKNVINYKFISASREVSNKENNKSLSFLSSKIYEKLETNDEHQSQIDGFKDVLCDADESLDGVYKEIFKGTIEKVRKFGGIKPDDTSIEIVSTLQHKELLQANTTVMYMHGSNRLPENYNGLGYMNLINIIFEIDILINEFKKSKSEKPADINLLFIEEPEAHTHPQIQYIFIKNIKDLLKDGITRDDGEKRKLQYIVSTHSSHIVSESDFNDIKYLRSEGNNVIAKNLKYLEKDYTESTIDEEKKIGEQNYKFLKQYLILHRTELFFADKAIFIEGDTERILLPAMIKKIDTENPTSSEIPLLSQNISIIEAGNYSHIFEKFIDFLGIKSLIITDIDSAMSDEKMKELKSAETNEILKKKIRQKVKVSDSNASITTNSSLNFFYGDRDLNVFLTKTIDQLKLKKDNSTKKWMNNTDGNLVCVYQTKEKNLLNEEYQASSFEDSFFHLNRQFIIDNKESFNSLKNINDFDDNTKDAYDLAENCIDKKPSFAIEILLNSKKDESSGNDFTNWQMPDYIRQGLLWLRDRT